MFDPKMLLVILGIALVIFGTKRLRSIGSDLGGAVKGFKQAMEEETAAPPSVELGRKRESAAAGEPTP